jgi:S-adenosylmethionine hydrolase
MGHIITTLSLTSPPNWLKEVSRTFHGRDIMAPVAAYLARGGSLSRLGPRQRATPLAWPAVVRRGRAVVGTIVHIDAFGNLITNLRASRWLPASWQRRCALRHRRRIAPVVSSYADGRPRQPIGVVGALGLMELAIRNGSAQRLLGAKRGDEVALLLPAR